jgi:predicted glycoside hydrolase/deacetylase ChbG (UPF0249 family)
VRVVVNADDLGFHPLIDEGIFLGFKRGVVTSSTILACGPAFASASKQALSAKIPIGAHLCLTSHLTPAARPGEVRWLAPGGRFRKNWAELAAAWIAKLIPSSEVVVEFRAQIARIQKAGLTITHLDTHQHLHLLPGVTSLVEVLAAELKVPLRWPTERPTPQWFGHPSAAFKSALLTSLAFLKTPRGIRRIPAYGIFESGRLNERRLLRLIANLPNVDCEIVTHPGFNPEQVPQDPTWKYEWEAELEAVTSPRVRAAFESREISLVSYKELAAEP